MKTNLDTLFVVCFVYCVNSFEVRDESLKAEVLETGWWGPRELRRRPDTSIRPFKVKFDDEVIEDLRRRLVDHRAFTPPLENVGFEYGFNTNALENWVHYWAHGYDFKARENYLNKYPHFKTNIQGLDIHFVWVKPEETDVEVIPLLFLHGWPGTFRELLECITYITTPDPNRPFAFEVIAPSLPGFGFSSGAVRPGLGAVEMAVVLRNLMHRVGFHNYYIQGGDWGSVIGSNIATLYPEEVLGFHTNFALARSPFALALWLVGSLDPPSVVEKSAEDRLYPLKKIIPRLIRETAYLHMQATKPDSLGVAMSDSPSGLLAYIFQLISAGTRKSNYYTFDGGLEKHYHYDNLLDILTIFWVTNSFTTSTRIYAESLNAKSLNSSVISAPTPVPTWALHAKDEIFYQSPKMLKFKFTNLLFSTNLDDYGHFLAFEKPHVLGDDLFKAIISFKMWREMQWFKDEL